MHVETRRRSDGLAVMFAHVLYLRRLQHATIVVLRTFLPNSSKLIRSLAYQLPATFCTARILQHCIVLFCS